MDRDAEQEMTEERKKELIEWGREEEEVAYQKSIDELIAIALTVDPKGLEIEQDDDSEDNET